jgi:hypothetical protein
MDTGQNSLVKGILIGVVVTLTTQFVIGIVGTLLFFGVISKAFSAISAPISTHAAATAQNAGPTTPPQPAAPDTSRAVNVMVTNMTHIEHDSTYKSIITMTVANTGTVDVRIFKGRVVFADLLGHDLKAVNIVYDGGLKAGDHKTYETTTYEMRDDVDEARFATIPLSDLKVRWEPQAILLANGTKWGE